VRSAVRPFSRIVELFGASGFTFGVGQFADCRPSNPFSGTSAS
jgi:hypothetical protein